MTDETDSFLPILSQTDENNQTYTGTVSLIPSKKASTRYVDFFDLVKQIIILENASRNNTRNLSFFNCKKYFKGVDPMRSDQKAQIIAIVKETQISVVP